MRKATTRFGRGALAAVAAGGLVLGLAGSAHASSNATAYVYGPNGARLGAAYFQADPYDIPEPGRPDLPGDAIRACDQVPGDGWGVQAQLDVGRNNTIDRRANGTGAQCSGWATGDLDEETNVRVRACQILNGTVRSCGSWSNGVS
ncbi:hypothetical protein E0500_005855 [Streptomyces sp. KM273126]|uniref:hypothetical protein n=1 Tax=Streptomyces sp. KM273126 TaxID=2545247 RepID=UPI00103D225E|nr:hypothetical protein [Streptomyces sp. KM273126]MBA2806980.1 hypothetical protein [Streptomyces sp. KM273126]